MYNCCLFQLDHRILATTTLASITGMWVATRNLPVDPRIRVLLNATLGMAAIQVSSTYLHAQKLLFLASVKSHLQTYLAYWGYKFQHWIHAISHCFQVTLGISTLLMYVPASLGSAHQAGALTLFTIVLSLVHSLRRPVLGAQISQQQKSLLKVWK
jgi:cytochrome c oxidase assembly protein subunit 15